MAQTILHTCIRTLVEFARYPLDGDLLEKQQSRGQHETEQQLGDGVNSSLRRGVVCLLPRVDERIIGDPNGQRPAEERGISATR